MSTDTSEPRRPAFAALASGPLLTAALALGVELLRPTALHLPEPGEVLLLAVGWSAFRGGFVPGFVSAAIAISYDFLFFGYFGGPTSGLSSDDMRHLLLMAFGAPVLAVMMGSLHRGSEQATRSREEAAAARLFRLLAEEASEPLVLADRDLRYTYVNPRACEMTGYDRLELLGKSIQDLIAPESLASQPLLLEELRTTGHAVTERLIVRKDGSRLQVESSTRMLEDGRLLTILRDVTARHAAYRQLQNALSLLQATLESTADGILVVNREGRWVGHNRKFAEIWSIPQALLASGDDARALEHVRDRIVDPDGFLARVRQLYAAPGESSVDEIRLVDGRVLERYSMPQRMGEQIVGRVWSFRDVTEARRKDAALRETEQRFLQTEKLEAVGRLAGGVAHDFNNMLTAILGEADLLLLRAALQPRERAQVESIRSAALRSARLTRQLLTFARRQHVEPRALELARLVHELEPLIRRLAGPHAEIRLELPEPGRGPWVHADAAQLEQAILNLVINAGDAMPEGGTLVVRLARVTLDDGEAGRRGARGPGAHAVLDIEDNGTGISDEVKPHLFEPFFTTKPPGKGTGLGLASVYGLIQQAGGFIDVDSEVGRGTTFHVGIPECAPGAGAPGTAGATTDAASEPAAPPATSVLVVDDEAHVLGFVVAVLRGAGFRVEGADGGAKALALARGRAEPFELLVTDVMMPDVSGPDLARALLEERRVRRVLFMSGFPGQSLERELAGLGRVALVQKPFRSDELVERIRFVLESPAG